MFLAMPLLTVSFLASLLNIITTRIKLLFIRKKEVVIFDSINEKSLTIAEKLSNCDTFFIFSNYKEEDDLRIKKLNALKVEEDICNIDIKFLNNKKITLCLFDSNEDNNLNKLLKLIEMYRDRDFKIYYITNNDLNTTILDSIDKGNIKLEIVNEKERVVYNVLEEKPLYLNALNKHISVLIVGCGNVGLEFLKTITWCGQMIDYTLTINVIDKNASKIREYINLVTPSILENYNYQFFDVDVNSDKMLNILDKIKDINYVIVTLPSEDLNIRTSLILRRYFLLKDRLFINKPIINLWISNPIKNKYIGDLINSKGDSYCLNAFGSIKDMYYDNSIIDSKLEKMARRVHLAYDKNDVNLENYYSKDYNVKSSRAFAFHIKYKLYSLGIDDTNIKSKFKNTNITSLLAINEHDRWVAYTRSIGYTLASISDVNKYKKITNSHVNHLAKVHPALVEYKDLSKVEKEIGVSLQDKDLFIVKAIPDILNSVKEDVDV